VVVSAGYDAAIGDELGRCAVTPQGYAHMTHMLSSLANGKLVLALEVRVRPGWLLCAFNGVLVFREVTIWIP